MISKSDFVYYICSQKHFPKSARLIEENIVERLDQRNSPSPVKQPIELSL